MCSPSDMPRQARNAVHRSIPGQSDDESQARTTQNPRVHSTDSNHTCSVILTPVSSTAQQENGVRFEPQI